MTSSLIEHPTYILGTEAIEACFGKDEGGYPYLDFGNLQALVFKVVELYEKRQQTTPDRSPSETLAALKYRSLDPEEDAFLTEKEEAWNGAIDAAIAIVKEHFKGSTQG